jgi:aspartokinase-like uncharacterized kinase
MKGFVDYNIDYVVKFGGSLLQNKDNLKALLEILVSAIDMGQRIVVIPGGGPTDNTIEEIDQWAKFHPDTHHHACALAQDQTGLMVADSTFNPRIRSCVNLLEVQQSLFKKCVPILLPSNIMFAIDPFERTWDITSDSMAAWFAWLMNCKQTLILTNVDGVYIDGNLHESSAFVERISAQDLIEMGHTAVDACFAPFIREKCINAWILNGKKPENLLAFFEGKEHKSTEIFSHEPTT